MTFLARYPGRCAAVCDEPIDPGDIVEYVDEQLVHEGRGVRRVLHGDCGERSLRMRILTVRQPWAWAIIHGGKDVENRVRNIAGDYRGPVAIHVGLRDDDPAFEVEHPMHGLLFSPCPWQDAPSHNRHHCRFCKDVQPTEFEGHGAIIGVVDLTDVHHAAECVYVGPAVEDFDGNFVSQEVRYCSPWAEDANVYHLALANPRALPEPIPYRGALGLRRLDEDTTARILAQIGA